jgi:hypothetical protein
MQSVLRLPVLMLPLCSKIKDGLTGNAIYDVKTEKIEAQK